MKTKMLVTLEKSTNTVDSATNHMRSRITASWRHLHFNAQSCSYDMFHVKEDLGLLTSFV